MSPYELKLVNLCYSHYKKTNSKEYSYEAFDGNDMINATNAIESLADMGYISNVNDYGISFSFQLEDSLIRFMEEQES